MWLAYIVIGICVVLSMIVAIILVPRLNPKDAMSKETYSYKNFEYPAFYKVVDKRPFALRMHDDDDEYKQFMYIGNFKPEEVQAYIDYLVLEKLYTQFENDDSRWPINMSLGRMDLQNEPHYINIVHYGKNSGVIITIW